VTRMNIMVCYDGFTVQYLILEAECPVLAVK
jgi:hypothetical protein